MIWSEGEVCFRLFLGHDSNLTTLDNQFPVLSKPIILKCEKFLKRGSNCNFTNFKLFEKLDKCVHIG